MSPDVIAAIRRLLARLLATVSRNHADAELDREVHAHLLLLEDAFRERGLSDDQARLAARRAFGGVALTKEHHRDARAFAWLDDARRDIVYAVRTLTAHRRFTLSAILMLAFGLGTTTAMFSVWNRALHSALPRVADPDGLVMLTDTNASGMWRGDWNSRIDGPRHLVTYEEFEQFRHQATGFAGLMAAQSTLDTWQARFGDGGVPEPVHGRLVSTAFFDVLGARARIGRLFRTGDDDDADPEAVISYAYWQRRFGGRADVIGRTFAVRNALFTIAGVAAQGFVGESTGQQPDLWLPLRWQPQVVPGSDWLHDRPPDKTMWLHVFGRLNAGVTFAQAEAQANAVLRANLESFYGNNDSDRRRALLEQWLRLSPGAQGASGAVTQFAFSVKLLLGAFGALLLIVCANVAGLLFARSAARRGEVAVRAALGAGRGRLLRQFAVESLVLAAFGGCGAVAVAAALYGPLVHLLQQVDSNFFLTLTVDPASCGFVIAATLGSAAAIALPSAAQLTAAGGLLPAGRRGIFGSTRELSVGRWLVGLQLALALPLLVGAGLLIRTASNLQHPNLGLRADRLLLARVDLGELVQQVARRDEVLRQIRARLERVPGVEGVSFSQLGLFGGGTSTAGIQVQDGTQLQPNIGLDRVGADYFKTLGIPLIAGRDISEQDRADTSGVVVINDALAARFFRDRNPLGLRIRTVDTDGSVRPYEIVGVAADAHTQSPRGSVEPRFFVPAEQRLSLENHRTFLIRTAPGVAGMVPAVQRAVAAVDPAIALDDLSDAESQLRALTAEERVMARLASFFGIVSVLLAAVGLYGVLSYGVARRAGEIGVRIALGAEPRGVVGMILRDSMGMLATGLFGGGVLALLASRLLSARLYGLADHDPFTFLFAAVVLVMAAAAAAYLPARRASSVDPLVVLRQE